MRKNKMTQRCEEKRVPGNGNWENYMWPHQLDKTAAPPPPPQSTGQSMTYSNIVQGNQGSFNGASFESVSNSDITINK